MEINLEDIVGKHWDEPGRGRKYCPSCHKYVPSRSLECPVCDMEFIRGEIYEPFEPDPEEAVEEGPYAAYVKYWVDKLGITFKVRHLIHTPRGECNVILPSTLLTQEMREWAEEVMKNGVKEDKLYYIDALVYWLRQFIDINSQEFKDAKKRLAEIFSVDFGLTPVTMEKVTYEKPRRMWDESYEN